MGLHKLLSGGLCLLLAAGVAVSVPAADTGPLQPLDLSSPRATLNTFLTRADAATQFVRDRYWHHPNRELARQLSGREDEMLRMLDLGQVAPAARQNVGGDALIYLYEVLSRIQLPPEGEIPSADDVEKLVPRPPVTGSADGSQTEARADKRVTAGAVATSASWTIPGTEITLVQIAEGPQTGQFVFSADTVARAREFYRRSRQLPYRRDVPIEHFAEMRPYLTMGGWLVSPQRIQSFPDWLKHSLFRQAVWKWLALFAIIPGYLVAILAMRRLTLLLESDARPISHLGRFLTPLLVFLVTRPLAAFVIRQLALTDYVAEGVALAAEVVAYLALAWLVWSLPVALADTCISARGERGESSNAHLLRFAARTLGFVSVVAVLFALSSRLGAPLAGLLAGAGIGGIAVALAAQGSIENFIGSLNLFGDRPVRVGDYCCFGDGAGPEGPRMGTVEAIGMRSTRIRGLDNTVTTIPNADFSKMPIVNYTLRSKILLLCVVNLRYETSEDQLRFVLASLREMLLGHPRVDGEEPSVRLVGLGESSLDIEIRVDINTPDQGEFRAIREDVLLRVMKIVRGAGTDFAFPSRTIYSARDSGLDTERQREAEARVRAWAAEQQMPFPNFSAEQRRKYRDTLDYPPEGSPDAAE